MAPFSLSTLCSSMPSTSWWLAWSTKNLITLSQTSAYSVFSIRYDHLPGPGRNWWKLPLPCVPQGSAPGVMTYLVQKLMKPSSTLCPSMPRTRYDDLPGPGRSWWKLPLPCVPQCSAPGVIIYLVQVEVDDTLLYLVSLNAQPQVWSLTWSK